ncbi:redoxin domain-containing protein [Pirellulales bacterium]|nr:redoxin domain-containing protein [Pirellulales bacterium]
MSQLLHRFSLSVLTILCTAWAANPTAANSGGQVGFSVASFTLNDYLGARHSLSQWDDAELVVVVFLGTECPLAKLYGARLAEIDKKYANKVQFVGINSNQQDTLREIAGYARRHGIEFPVLKDAGAKVADAFGAKRTPEAFVLDRQRVVRYRGRIDDQFGVGYARPEAEQADLITAIDALLAGGRVDNPSTVAVGCLISRPRDIEADSTVTYAADIAPILNQHCVKCHRDGEIAPFALTNYDAAAAWSETLLEVIDDGRMPPWHASPEHGEFLNDARLTDREKEQFRTWVKNGAPAGDLAVAPPAPEFVEGWQIPEPDVVYRIPEPYQVPATGVVEYQHFYFDPGFEEDMWIRGAEARPGNRQVVHHVILFHMDGDRDTHRPEDPLFNAIAAFAPGMPAIMAPEGIALRIPAGSKLGFQVHYTPNGSPQFDSSEAGLIFADPEQVQHEVRVQAGLNFAFLIPPGADDYRVSTNYNVQRESLLFSLTPHMHYRGKSFRFTAKYPGGGEEVLLDVPRYDFNWQNIYLLRKPKRLPAGTVVAMEASFDNSAGNPLNPDPQKTVGWGDQTWQEMMIGTMGISDFAEELQ